MGELVTTQISGKIAYLCLNRPEKKNALNLPLLNELIKKLHELNSNSKIRCIVVEASGTVFCAGLDLEEAADLEKSKLSGECLATVFGLINNSPHITVALIQGAALAGGAGLMCACDFSFAADNSIFGFPEVHRGLVAALVLALLSRKIKQSDLRELLLLGEFISAEKALSIGLISALTSPTDIRESALNFIERAVKGGPKAIKKTKELIDLFSPISLDSALKIALKMHSEVRISDEAQEGIAAFKEKRTPKWSDN